MSHRSQQIDRLGDSETIWDVLVIGGGAMGLGVALASIQRGYRTALVEQQDFAHGTSSRSTKLIHGGIRYLEQRDYGLVREALRERRKLCQHYPHVVQPLSFVIPTYSRREHWYYRSGTWLYDTLAGRKNLARSYSLSASQTHQEIPFLKPERLLGGIHYQDAQFDDARLALAVAQRIWQLDGVAVNYARVINLIRENNRIQGVILEDRETDITYPLRARMIVNATGVAVDEMRRLASPDLPPRLRFSQGTHIVLDASPHWRKAMLVPRTPDGRVIFIIPWLGKLLIGTTDVEIDDPSFEPVASRAEVDYLLELAGRYLLRTPTVTDVKSVFAGHRALVLRLGDSPSTHRLSRTHRIEEEPQGLLNVLGGKWTTFSAVARDVVERIVQSVQPSQAPRPDEPVPQEDQPSAKNQVPLSQDQLASRPGSDNTNRLHPQLTLQASDIEHAVQHEMARTVDDVLSRRTRALFLDARAALEVAPQVARLLAKHLGRNDVWIQRQSKDFQDLARRYLISGVNTYGG